MATLRLSIGFYESIGGFLRKGYGVRNDGFGISKGLPQGVKVVDPTLGLLTYQLDASLNN